MLWLPHRPHHPRCRSEEALIEADDLVYRAQMATEPRVQRRLFALMRVSSLCRLCRSTLRQSMVQCTVDLACHLLCDDDGKWVPRTLSATASDW